MSSAPAVTVLITVFNGARYVGEAIESILAQSFPDFELLIVDDGSSDATPEVLRRYSDPRLQTITLPENRGIASARNSGIEAARGRVLAFLDHDDAASPDRIEKQLAFLDRHPEVGLVGAAVEFIDAGGESLRSAHLPESDTGIRWLNLVECPMRQSTLTVQRDLARQHRYDPRYLSLSDWDFIQRILAETRAANLPEVLVRYRSHPANVSHQHRTRAIETGALLSCRAIRTALPDFHITLEEVKLLRAAILGLVAPNEKKTPEEIRRGLRLYLDLLEAFKRSQEQKTDRPPHGIPASAMAST